MRPIEKVSVSLASLRFLLVPVVLIITICAALSPPARSAGPGRPAPDSLSTLTVEGRLAVFDDAWQTIFDRYYDPQFRGVDWTGLRAVYRPLAAEAANGRELYAVLRRLISSLNDVHTRIHAPDERFDWWKPRFVGIGLNVKEIEGRAVVVSVERGSAPERAGIRVGDQLEEVNGTRVPIAISERFASQPNHSLRASLRSRTFASLIDGPTGSLVELVWSNRSGQLLRGGFELQWHNRKLGLRVRRERGRYAVVEIDAFTPTIALDFSRQMKSQLRGARGIVLDLRGNGGGEAESMADVASSFLSDNVPLGIFTDRWGLSFSVRTRAKSLLAPEALTQTKLPLVILVSERTSSAAEILTAALKSARRGKVIGSETCGCVLAIRNPHTLPDGGTLDVSELDYKTSLGVRLEENGVVPDEEIVVRRTDLYSKRDPALERAFQILASDNRRQL
jgi:carboxyl-terminal processing protease